MLTQSKHLKDAISRNIYLYCTVIKTLIVIKIHVLIGFNDPQTVRNKRSHYLLYHTVHTSLFVYFHNVSKTVFKFIYKEISN